MYDNAIHRRKSIPALYEKLILFFVLFQWSRRLFGSKELLRKEDEGAFLSFEKLPQHLEAILFRWWLAANYQIRSPFKFMNPLDGKNQKIET